MQKNHQKLRLFITLTFFCFGLIQKACAGFDEAYWAYKQGYYNAAFNEFYLLAAEGDPIAQLNLGIMNELGRGVAKDNKVAVYWFRKAAEQGNAKAQYNLGLKYIDGLGVSKDDIQGYFWLLLASGEGITDAKQHIDILEKVLNPYQLTKAQEDARNWKPKTPQQFSTIDMPDKTVNHSKNKAEPNKSPQPTESEKSSGTGFIVSQNQIVTNVHVVEGCTILKVNGEPATIRVKDTANDLALIDTILNGSVATLRAGILRQGDEIKAVGYPLYGLLASGAQITSGNVSALAGIKNDARFIQISAPVQPGNSGGPLVDASGNVVGVIVSKLNAVAIASMNGDIPQNINFAISPLVLKGFLEANQVKYKTAASNKNLSTANVMSLATRYTVLIECIK